MIDYKSQFSLYNSSMEDKINVKSISQSFIKILKSVYDCSVEYLKKYYKKTLITIFPAKTISTFFGMGYLPEWQGHWSSLLAIPIIVIITYISTGFTVSIAELSVPIAFTAIILFFIGIISIYIFHIKDPAANEEIMIHTVFGQVIVLAFSGPAVLYAGYHIVDFSDFLCEKFLYCAPWFYKVITYVPILCIPFAAYRLVDIIKPWPSSTLDRDYNNCISSMLEALVVAIYTLILLYLISFILFNLTMDEALLFFHNVFQALIPSIHEMFILIMIKLNAIGVFEFLHMQNYYDSLIKDYYNLPPL